MHSACSFAVLHEFILVNRYIFAMYSLFSFSVVMIAYELLHLWVVTQCDDIELLWYVCFSPFFVDILRNVVFSIVVIYWSYERMNYYLCFIGCIYFLHLNYMLMCVCIFHHLFLLSYHLLKLMVVPVHHEAEEWNEWQWRGVTSTKVE